MIRFAALALAVVLAACAAPQADRTAMPGTAALRPIDGLTVTVHVVSPAAIHAALQLAGPQAAARGVALFDPNTCAAYLPAGVDHAEFARLLVHELDHALGREHSADGVWLPVDPARAAALQRRCVQTPEGAR